MNHEVKSIENKSGKQLAGGSIKNIFFMAIIAAMFAAGCYSLYLASTYAGNARSFTTDNLLRTAGPTDTDKIETALGRLADRDFIFVVLDTSLSGISPNLELSARNAARALSDSGLVSSVRILYPQDYDFITIVEQNNISRFPAVLAVRKEGGIVQIADDHSQGYLLFAYNSIWGKTSDCSDSKSAVY